MVVKRHLLTMIAMIVIGGILLAACSPGLDPAPGEKESQLEIVATTTFIGEVVERVAGNSAHITVLLEPGQNPHAYQPSPQDMVRISSADIVFSNGFGLEEFLEDLVGASDNTEAVVEVSRGIAPLVIEADGHEEEHLDHAEGAVDPHVWFDPNNLKIWTENITDALAGADPENAELYRRNADQYLTELDELDSWIREQVAAIPLENRKLVTDHMSFGYFADEYGFQQIGAVIPAATTEAETSGKQLAELMETIKEQDIKAIFVSMDIDPAMAEIVAEDTGIPLVPLYFGSLTRGGPVDTYQDFMRYDVEAIASALGE
jgi:ABC-type Zn uptake system ZnuABC Zn-binding protein ZnuA